LDGSVANFHFEAKELGYRLSDSELDELKRNRYGDVRGRQSNLVESPAQLLLEEASSKQSASKRSTSGVQHFQAHPKVPADGPNPTPVVQIQKTPEALLEDKEKSSAPAADDTNKTTRLSSPVKQREYRRPDGRKRIIPEAVGFPSNQDSIPSRPQNQVVDFSSLDQRMNGIKPSYGSSGNCNNCGARDRSGITARANITESFVIQKASTGTGNDGRLSVEHAGSVVPGSSASRTALSIHVLDKKGNEDSLLVCLEAKPVERATGDTNGVGSAFSTKETEIRCTRGTETLWSDRISGKVTVLAGNANFWAVGCEDGCLQVSDVLFVEITCRLFLYFDLDTTNYCWNWLLCFHTVGLSTYIICSELIRFTQNVEDEQCQQ
jgi:protein HIRA/HIR1